MVHQDPSRTAARADLARLLAACYYEPGPEFAEEHVFDAMREAAATVDPELEEIADRIGRGFAATGGDELLVDYTRLFLGPVDILAKPYGSVWLDTDAPLMGDSTMAVLQHYEDAGFEVDEGFRDLPDHIAVELEFLYVLLFREAEVRLRQDTQTLAGLARMRQRFLGEHLGQWVGAFAAAVTAGAQTSYYRDLAELTVRFVALEAARTDAH
jgi:putative dimethyl sulfoxide reductase chaperone